MVTDSARYAAFHGYLTLAIKRFSENTKNKPTKQLESMQ
jgi:hypothetical protein